MFAVLSGKILDFDDNQLILDVHGVGYDISVPSSFRLMYNIGDFVQMPVVTHVREDQISLYGFKSFTDKKWFRLLTSVQGVGNKMALSILDKLTPDQIATAVTTEDVHVLRQADGVGPKLAKRMITELRDKVIKMPIDDSDTSISVSAPQDEDLPQAPKKTVTSTTQKNKKDLKEETPASQDPKIRQDAISALSNLGYAYSDCFQIITVLSKEWQNTSPETISLDNYVKEGLKRLSSNN